MDEVDHKLPKTALAWTALGAAANLASSARSRGPRSAAAVFALATGLPALGELLATGPLGLLRHRTRPRVGGVPVAVPLGWYSAIAGSLAVAERVLEKLPLDERGRRRALPPAAALVGTSLDLVLDPAGLDAGLWEWKSDGFYAPELEGPNGRRGVPLINYLGWLALVGSVAHLHGRVSGHDTSAGFGRLPILVLLPYYLAAAAWAVKKGRLRFLAYSALFPVALLASLVGPRS